jgi:hypothetical protein
VQGAFEYVLLISYLYEIHLLLLRFCTQVPNMMCIEMVQKPKIA